MANDDVLQEALEQLEKLDEYNRTYGGWNVTEKTMVYDPLVRSIRLVIDEVQRLRDIVERGPEIMGGGIEGPFVGNDGNPL